MPSQAEDGLKATPAIPIGPMRHQGPPQVNADLRTFMREYRRFSGQGPWVAEV